MRTTALLSILVFTALSSCQTTQQSLRKGMIRTAGSFSYANLSSGGDDVTTTDLQLSTGTLFEDSQEIGVNVGYTDVSAGATQATAWDLGIYGRYYLETTAALLPWVQLDLGWADNDVDSAFLWAAGAGVTQFVTQGGALEAGVEYQDITGGIDLAGFRVFVGYALFF